VETVIERRPATSAPVVFDVPVPTVPTTLPFYSSRAPTEMMHTDPFKTDCLAIGSERANDSAQASRPEHVIAEDKRCHFDEKTGDLELYPEFSKPKLLETPKGANPQKQAEVLLHSLVDDVSHPDALVRESLSLTPGLQLQHARIEFGDAAPKIVHDQTPTFLYVAAQRWLEGYRVDGPGSRALAIVNARGDTEGYSRSWHIALNPEQRSSAHTAGDVKAEIERQLSSIRPRTTARVQEIELVYYDGNGPLIQPAYRFVAELGADTNSLGHARHVVGWVPYAEADEHLPVLGAVRMPPHVAPRTALREDGIAPADDLPAVTLGRYVTRNDSSGWLNDAAEFLDAALRPDARVRFRDAQFFAATPDLFLRNSQDYVDSVDIALVEAHGAPWVFATDGDSRDFVYFGGDALKRPAGYAPGRGGKLKHLVMHSCEVVAAPPDVHEWYAPWRELMKAGLMSVVGYRSEMYIDDGAGAAFGQRLARGEPVKSAWFSAVAALSAYHLNPSAQFTCDGELPLGLAAAVFACGAGQAAVNEVADVDPNCLEVWWMGNSSLQRDVSNQGGN
jgi:hypothetical protein